MTSMSTSMVLVMKYAVGVRGHFAPIKQWTLLTEKILYQLLGVRAIPVLPNLGRLSGVDCIYSVPAKSVVF